VRAGNHGASYYARHEDESGILGISVRARIGHRFVAADGRSFHAEEPLVQLFLSQKTKGTERPSLKRISLCDNEGHHFKLTILSETQDDTKTQKIYATDIKEIRDHMRFNDPSYHMTLSVLFSSGGEQYEWVAQGIRPSTGICRDPLPPPHDTPVGFLVQLALFFLLPLALLIAVVWGVWFLLAKRKA